MARGDFADLKAKVCRSAHFDDTSTYDLNRAGDAINEAVDFITGQRVQWDFLMVEGSFDLTSGTDLYTFDTIATEVGETGSIEDIYAIANDTEGGVLLQGMGWQELEGHALSTQDGDPQGWPWAYAQYGSSVRFYPNLDKAYTMRFYYKRIPGALTNDADTPVIPLRFRDTVLVPYAASVLLEQEGGGEAMNDYGHRRRRFEEGYAHLLAAHGSGRAGALVIQAPGFTRDLPGTIYGFGWDA